MEDEGGGRRGSGGGYRRRYGGRGGRGGGYGQRSRGFERDRGPAPVEVGQEVDVTVESVGRKGDGIARVDNVVLFVPATKAGDKVRVKINSLGNNFATGEVVGGGE